MSTIFFQKIWKNKGKTACGEIYMKQKNNEERCFKTLKKKFLACMHDCASICVCYVDILTSEVMFCCFFLKTRRKPLANEIFPWYYD